MFDPSEVDDAVEIQRRAYELLLWVGRAIERGFIPADHAHEYSSERASAAAWLQRHYLDLPKSCRPSERSGPGLDRYANYFASYLATSFDLDPRPGYRLTSRCGCYCGFCSRLVAAQHLKPKKVTSRDKKRAQELKHAYVAALARESRYDAAPARVANILGDEGRSRAAALAAYGKELLSRCRGGGSSGTAVLALWREFAWTSQGSPNRKFRLRSKDIIEAERTLIAALAAYRLLDVGGGIPRPVPELFCDRDGLLDLDRVLELGPDLELEARAYLPALVDLAWSHYKLRRYEDALSVFEQAIRVIATEAADESGAPDWTDDELELEPLELEHEPEVEPEHTSAFLGRAWTFYALGRYEEALPDFDRTLELEPESSDALDGRGWTYYRLGRDAEALSDFGQALERDPANVDFLRGRGWTLYALGRNEEAMLEFERVLETRPSDANACNGFAWAEYELGRYEQALSSFDRALQLDPNYVNALDGRGRTYFRLKRYEDAVAVFDEALAIDGEYIPALAWRGSARCRLHQYDRALADAERLLEVAPEDPQGFFVRGRAQLGLGRDEEALAALDRALELNADYAAALAGRGATLHRLRRYDDALGSFERALAINPRLRDALVGRSRLHADLGHVRQALRDAEAALALDASDLEAREVREHLMRAEP